MRKGEVKYRDITAGWIIQDDAGFHFVYEEKYVMSGNPPVSKTLPFGVDRFESTVLFPFFDGLIPEGWLLDIAEDNWKLDRRDRMGLLLACCKDCIGAVSVHPVMEENNEN